MDYKKIKKNGITFETEDNIVVISEIFSFLGGIASEGISGHFVLSDESGFYNGQETDILSLEENGNEVVIVSETEKTRITSIFKDLGGGVWERTDKLKNISGKESRIFSCLSRFVLSGSSFDILTQEGSWCNENDTKIKPVDGNVLVSNNGIRTTEDASPFIALIEKNQRTALCFHLLPVGHWKISAQKKYSGQTPYLVLDMGLYDGDLSLKMEKDEEITLPKIVFFKTDKTDVGFGSEKIHNYIYSNKKAVKQMPLLYNTWFLNWADLSDFELLKNQVRAAKEFGLEYFVVDSGWFGKPANNWYNMVGDWYENKEENFKGRLKEFSDFVRSEGLKFGLWFEIERASKNSDIYKESPELFMPLDASNVLFDFTKKEAREKVIEIVSKNIKDFNLEFIKFDYNAPLFHDPQNSSFFRYYEGWYKTMDTLREMFPQVFFECCSAGGLRSDISTLLHYDAMFSSDTVHPYLTLRITDGMALRIPPRFITKWLALREKVNFAGRDNEKDYVQILSSAGHSMEETVSLPDDFLEAYTVLSGLGFTARIDDYSDHTKEVIKKVVDTWKTFRPFVSEAVSTPLFMPKENTNFADDLVWQLSSGDEKILVALHLDNYKNGIKVIPKNIEPSSLYEVSFVGNFVTKNFDEAYTVKGEELIRDGVLFAFPRPFTGRLAKIKKISK